jgi:hypothetical protein
MRIAYCSLLIASTAAALPAPDTRFRPGANHHLGDDSFVAAHGRAPGQADTEKQRMATHLVHVRKLLASRAATKPELEARRAELLGYLDDYIAKGITPANTHLPWRSPVFIDDAGAICAVGYLIERSVGRALPERIAAEQRYEFLEDIATNMPEVSAWIASSGFTLEELASIQPAYSEPEANTWVTWNLVEHPRPDGAYKDGNTRGTFARNRMEGAWTVTSEGGVVVGKGTMVHGAGRWTSFHADGKSKLAEGPYADNRAHGAWQFFHASGNLAAEGRFVAGRRDGAWRFYYDTPKKTPIATGKFDRRGWVRGKWQHFDATGALIAVSKTETPSWNDGDLGTNGGAGFTLTVVPGADRIRYAVHQGMVAMTGDDIQADGQRLETFALGSERIYIHDSSGADPVIYDTAGLRLEKVDGIWRGGDCRWSVAREQVARSGDVARLHGLLYTEASRRVRGVMTEETRFDAVPDPGPRCKASRPIAPERGTRIDALLARRDLVRAESPAFVKRAVLGEPDPDDATDPDDPDDAEAIAERARADREASDLTQVLASHMVMYVEWPHIDGRFVEVFGTMAGRYVRRWTDGDPEARDDN